MKTKESGAQGGFRMAVIGAGIHAETNVYPSLANHLVSGVETVAVCDLDVRKAEAFAALHNLGDTVNINELVIKV